MDNREKAVAVAAQALDLDQEYSGRIIVTTREEIWEGSIFAFNIHAAARELKRMWDEREIDRDRSSIEGDECGWVSDNDYHKPELEDEIEVDLRHYGEPYAWTACQIVKALAVSDPDIGVTYWISRAKEALKGID
jgi:hypothetical protein